MVDTQTLRYSVVAGWEQLPAGTTHLDCVGVDVDGDDNVYLLTRNENQVLVYGRDGSFVRAWGKGMFEGGRPHGLRFGPDGNLYVAEAGTGGTTSTAGQCDQVGAIGPYTGGKTSRIAKITATVAPRLCPKTASFEWSTFG